MLISLLVDLVVLGLVLWLVEKFIPMAEPFPTVIRVVVGIIAVVLVLQAFGIPILGVRLY